MFIIQSRVDGSVLTAGSRSYGSQGGVGRLWSPAFGDALLFESEEAVDAFISSEWGDGWQYAACKIVERD